jgi:predicted flavoprotein YhiN
MKEAMPQLTVRYQGLFDFDGVYASVIDWAKNYGYMWHEKTYKHKVPRPTGAEQELEWVLQKKVTEHVNFSISFRVHIWDLQEVQVETPQGKKAMSQARVLIVMNGAVATDWKKKFTGSKFKEWLGKRFENIKIAETGEYMDTLAYRMLSLQAIIKKYFNMQSQMKRYGM